MKGEIRRDFTTAIGENIAVTGNIRYFFHTVFWNLECEGMCGNGWETSMVGMDLLRAYTLEKFLGNLPWPSLAAYLAMLVIPVKSPSQFLIVSVVIPSLISFPTIRLFFSQVENFYLRWQKRGIFVHEVEKLKNKGNRNVCLLLIDLV